MARRVGFAARARRELRDLYDLIARDGGEERAARYVGGLEEFCSGLAMFPERGARRDGLRPGVRVIGFRRRVTVAFAVREDDVVILRVLYAGRDLTAAFAVDDEGG